MPGAMRVRPVRLAGREWQVAGAAGDSFLDYVQDHANGLRPLQALARAVLSPDGVAVDVGANIGLSALGFAALLPQGRVLALEPGPGIVAALRQTVALNRLQDRIAVLPLAVGAQLGTAVFQEGEHSAGSSLVEPATWDAGQATRVEVPVTTLDTVVREQGLARLDLLKVDVEGWETEVLDGAQDVLARFRPVVVLEFNAWVLQCNRNANPRATLEDWLARFPFAHALRGEARPEPLTRGRALPFLHDHLVERKCQDDLVLSFDAGWLDRWDGSGERT